MASTNNAADKVSAELESTKGKLDNATATGKELGDEVKKLKGQLQREKDDCADNMQEYERKLKALFDTKEKRMTEENMKLQFTTRTLCWR